MAGNIIGTSSYSEAMDLSDLDDCGYDQDSFEDTPSPAATAPSPSTLPDAPPIKIRKKPGRKPNPASPALRKAQNRAAQRAFRERKERHMKDLETNIKGIRDHRDKLLQENQKMSTESEILKAENWYLKGIVLSLQLVCLQHNLVIPQHCPHVDEKTLDILNQSIPKSIASYINVNSKNKLQISSKLLHDSPEIKNIRNRFTPPQQQQNTSWYGNAVDNSNNQHSPQQQMHNTTCTTTEDTNPYVGLPPLSPMSTTTDSEKQDSKNMFGTEIGRELPSPHPVMLSNEPITSNLAAIQTLRLRLRLQSACVRMDSIPYAIQPTLLQLTIPHDPRIDLIPTPHMRDRMILYRDQFDLDDCFRCLLSGSVFHGGDPAISGNWQLPAEFFEKFWFLTIDYNLRRYTNQWRKLQGLQEIKQDQIPCENPKPSQTNNQPMQGGLSYEDLSGYLGVQLTPNSKNTQQQQQQQGAEVTPIQLMNGYGVLDNSAAGGGGGVDHRSNSAPANSPWDNMMIGQKKYDMMMTGMYNNNMDRKPNQ
ncbi:hypothetical protein EDC94DRAFT_554285 [Helicostylum pulchrum]|nr:hypothetical protein EDC94DRAFT_554285 [Helicostylum pulchrum]